MWKWLRRFDLEYWQMREALGYPIPNWVDRKWPRKLNGNAGDNPFKCGPCQARQKYPELYSDGTPVKVLVENRVF